MCSNKYTVVFWGRVFIAPLALFVLLDEAIEYAALYSLEYKKYKQKAFVVEGNFLNIGYYYF